MGKDDGAEALKLVKKLDQEFKAFKKAQDAWEKEQSDWIKRIEKNLIDAHNEQEKKLVKAHNDQDEKFVKAHNDQDKKFVDAFNNLKDWVNNTFDKKGLFN